jgi:hypothetical protein
MGASRQANKVARHLATAAIVGTAAHAQNARKILGDFSPYRRAFPDAQHGLATRPLALAASSSVQP